MFLDETIRECNTVLAELLKKPKATKNSDIPIIHGKAELELHDKAIRNKAIDDFLHKAEMKITDVILQHQHRLDFASGLAYANLLLDDVAEQLKVGGENAQGDSKVIKKTGL